MKKRECKSKEERMQIWKRENAKLRNVERIKNIIQLWIAKYKIPLTDLNFFHAENSVFVILLWFLKDFWGFGCIPKNAIGDDKRVN